LSTKTRNQIQIVFNGFFYDLALLGILVGANRLNISLHSMNGYTPIYMRGLWGSWYLGMMYLFFMIF